MSWLLRLLVYLLVVGGVAVLLSCEAPFAALPWNWLCSAISPPPSDPLALRITPHWYALPFYGVLRAATFDIGPLEAKTVGAVLLACVLLAPGALVFAPWSRAPARAWGCVAIAFAAFALLGWTGAQLPSATMSSIGMAAAGIYLAMLLIAFPLLAGRPNSAASPGAASN